MNGESQNKGGTNLQHKCFVIMPFKDEFRSIYENIIKPALKLAGFISIRSDEKLTPGEIMDDVRSDIHSSDCLIALITEDNPNVFYELGMAHALGKPVILVAKKKDKFPFDIRNWRRIEYDNESEISDDLYNTLKTLKNEIIKPEISMEPEVQDLQLGDIAISSGVINRDQLDECLKYFKDSQDKKSMSDIMLEHNYVNKEKLEMLKKFQLWINSQLKFYAETQSDETWIQDLTRMIKIIDWRDRSAGEKPIKQRYFPILYKKIDIYDEAVYTDWIIYRKFKSGENTARSSGIVQLHEIKTEYFNCYMSPNSIHMYRKMGGNNLDYTIELKEKTMKQNIPVLFRQFSYFNGFQKSEYHDNNEAGIEIKDRVEHLILHLDLSSLKNEPKTVKGEIYIKNEKEDLEIKGEKDTYYVEVVDPPKNSIVVINWRT